MTAIEQSEALRQQAITLLLAEAQTIHDQLRTFGYDPDNKTALHKKRGRPAKITQPFEISQPGTTDEACS